MKISVIVPSFNQGRYLNDCLASICAQLTEQDELFVVDGGSTDESAGVIGRFAPHITKWVSERDRGQAHAVNKGLAWASGDAIVWCNSDDLLMPGALAKLRAEWNQEYDMLAFSAVWMNATGTEATKFPLPKAVTVADFHDGSQPVNQPCCVMSRAYFLKLGGLREHLHYSLDYDLFARAMKRGIRLRQIDFWFAVNRIHPATKTNSGKLTAELEVVAREHFGQCAKRYPSNIFYKYKFTIVKRFGVRYMVSLFFKKVTVSRRLPGGYSFTVRRRLRRWLQTLEDRGGFAAR